MKKVYLFMLLNIAFINLQAQNFQWANRGGLWAYDYGYGITTDDIGNVYLTGKYEMAADFSGNTLPCQGNHDIYLVKYTPSGALNWITTAGGSLGDYGESVTTDGSTFVAIAGEIEGYNNPITFVGSNITLTAIGANDIFVAKYDMSGTLLWARQAGSIDNEKGLAVASDNAGNIYVAGFFNNSATFGNITINGWSGNDIFLAKYDANGTIQWVRKAGSSGRDEAKSIKCDASGNVYVTGLFSGSCDFGTQTLVAPNGYYDAFVAKYTTSGTLSWAKQAGGSYDDVGWSLVIDNAGKVFVSGEFNAYAMFDNIPLTTTGNADAFVACYDAAGNVQWAKGAGGSLIERARGVGSDGNNIYITGQFGATANFGSYSVTAADSSDIFIAALSNSGTFLWAKSVGGGADSVETLGYESGNTICADAQGNVYASGSILNGGVFGTTTLLPYDRTDVFITKIGSTTTGQNDLVDAEQIKIYPNPSNGNFTIDISGISMENTQLCIFNCVGQLVDKRTSFGSAKQIDVDLSVTQQGIYMLELSDGDRVISRKKIVVE